MKIILSILLGTYSIVMGAYALSEIYGVQGCSHDCFKGESPFPGGDGSSGGTRAVNVQYRASGNESVPSQYQSTLSGALNTAMGDWNAASDGTGTTPYHFQQTQGSNKTDVEIVYVDSLPRDSNGRQPCMSLHTTKDAQGAIQSATLYIPRTVLQNSSQQDLAEMIEHELGHFIGLADFYGNADQCQTIMAQAKEGCTSGLQGSQQIASGDVSEVKKYLNSQQQSCKAERKPSTNVEGGGGYTDPNPSPIFYPETCYYYYDAVDLYQVCDCQGGYRYIGTVYYLTDVICD